MGNQAQDDNNKTISGGNTPTDATVNAARMGGGMQFQPISEPISRRNFNAPAKFLNWNTPWARNLANNR